MTNEEAMGILYSHSRINPKIGCEQRFIAYHNGDVEKALDIALKAIQQTTWIPCSERLPKDKETVLVTFKHFVSGNTIGLGSVILLRGKPHWHVREQSLGTYDVLAWMPLPPCYDPQESEDKE